VSIDERKPATGRQTAGPERLGDYEVLLELAAGGMATVVLARALHAGPDTGRRTAWVAIKRPHRHLATGRAFLTMLVDEARLASAIDHPNVVRVRELGFDAGVPFIVMDYVEGASLAELRRELAAKGRALDARVAVRVALDLLAGLSAAHGLRDGAGRAVAIVHRDVSPHNVLVGTDGRARLTDFGIAKAEDRIQTTRTHEVKGKLAYLAPERVDRRRICTVQSDVFSVGLVVWECLAGRRLFRSEQVVDLLQEVMTAPIPRLGDLGAPVPRALDDAIARALSRDLAVRYPTADAFARALREAVRQEGMASSRDVARLIDAIFGQRLRARAAFLRAALGDDAPGASPVVAPDDAGAIWAPEPSARVLAELAPAAPKVQYVVDVPLPPPPSRLRPWLGTAGGLAAGVLLGVLAMWPGHRAPFRPAQPQEPRREAAEAKANLDPEPLPSRTHEARAASATPGLEPASADAGGAPLHAQERSREPPPAGTVRNGFTRLK
jgi:serine/threonine-protein kinase